MDACSIRWAETEGIDRLNSLDGGLYLRLLDCVNGHREPERSGLLHGHPQLYRGEGWSAPLACDSTILQCPTRSLSSPAPKPQPRLDELPQMRISRHEGCTGKRLGA